MNKAFTKNKIINLDESYYLESDGDSGVVLTFHEPRKKELTEKVDGKTVKTGVIEAYLFEDKWYFTRIVQALKKYVELSQNSSESIEELLIKTDKIFTLLNDIDKEFKQF